MIKPRSVDLVAQVREPLPGSVTQKRGSGLIFFSWNPPPHEAGNPDWKPPVAPYVLENGPYAGWVLLVAESSPQRPGTELLVPPHLIANIEPWESKGAEAWAALDAKGAPIGAVGPSTTKK